MADFHQNGVITTLHNLHNRKLEDLESDLKTISETWPMALVLPSLYSEIEQPALAQIIDEIAKIDYLAEIIVGLDRADPKQFRKAKEFFARLPQRTRILWQDGPGMKAVAKTLENLNLGPTEPGKGRNVWYCFGYLPHVLPQAGDLRTNLHSRVLSNPASHLLSHGARFHRTLSGRRGYERPHPGSSF